MIRGDFSSVTRQSSMPERSLTVIILKGKLAPSLANPHKSKDLASRSRSGQNSKRVSGYVASKTLSSQELEKYEVSFIRRKSCRFKAVHDTLASKRYSLDNYDSSSEDGEVAAPSSPTRMTMEKKVVASSSPDEVLAGQPEASTVGVTEVTPEVNPKLVGVDVEGQTCHSSAPEELLTVVATQTEATSKNVKLRCRRFQEKVVRTMFEWGLMPIMMTKTWMPKMRSVRHDLALARMKMDVKKKVVVEGLVKGDEDQTLEF
ncbi:hypothetical protein ACFE04_015075 [Oxalis oulophora]